MLKCVWLICLSLSLGACATAGSGMTGDAPARSVASIGSDANMLVDQMAAELSSHISTSKKDFAVFHYEHAAKRPTWQRFQQSIQRFWIAGHYDAVAEMFGPGMYASVDPISTENFGKPDFSLLMISLHAGTRYLSINNNTMPYSLPTTQALTNFGCEDVSRLRLAGFVAMLGERTSNCRTIALNVLRKLDIDAIFYPFATVPVAGCKNQKAAFLILRTDHIGQSDVREFVQEIPHPDPYAADRLAIERLGRNQMVTPPKEANGYSLWPRLEVNPADQDSGWAKEHLLLCQP